MRGRIGRGGGSGAGRGERGRRDRGWREGVRRELGQWLARDDIHERKPTVARRGNVCGSRESMTQATWLYRTSRLTVLFTSTATSPASRRRAVPRRLHVTCARPLHCRASPNVHTLTTASLETRSQTAAPGPRASVPCRFCAAPTWGADPVRAPRHTSFAPAAVSAPRAERLAAAIKRTPPACVPSNFPTSTP